MTRDTSTDIENLLHEVRVLVDRHQWLAQHQGWRFNVFELLDRGEDEVKGHSAFLATLLNPRGSHGRGAAFLVPFLRRLAGISGDDFAALAEDDPESWSVRSEVAFDGTRSGQETADGDTGRIDILLEGPRNLVAIENKIYAADQDRQLERYQQHLDRRAGGKRSALVYLTLDGHEPSKASLGRLSPSDVRLMSYRFEIDQWVGDCIRAAALLPPVRETLIQYQAVVRRLSGRGLSREFTMEIAELLASPQSLRAADQIAKALPEAKARIQMAFWRELEDKLKALLERLGIEKPRPVEKDRYTQALVSQYHESCRSTSDYGIGFPLRELAPEGKLVLFVAVHHNVYYGLRLLEGHEWVPEVDASLGSLKDLDGMPKEPGWLGWKYPEPKLNFHVFGEECVNLADKNQRSARIDELVGGLEGLATQCIGAET